MSKKYTANLSTSKNTFYIDKMYDMTFQQEKIKWNEIHITQLHIPKSELELDNIYLKLSIKDFDTNKITKNENNISVDGESNNNYTMIIFDLQKKYKYDGNATACINGVGNRNNFHLQNNENIEVKYSLELLPKKDGTKYNIDNVYMEFFFK